MTMLWAVPLVPLTVAVVVLLSGRRANRWAGPVSVLGTVGATGGAAWALVVRPSVSATWLVVSGRPIEVGLRADGLGAAMAVLVASVTVLVLVYSLGEFTGDPSAGRFFGFMSLFCGAMLVLVLARDVLTLLAAWEVVGACSYALIGFRYAEPGKAAAANQAFLVTRSADLGLYVATFAMFAGTGSFALEGAALAGPLLTIVSVGLVVAAAGKSAQLPFSTWLFAAMEGPSPVSALLHSATMVAAGAYLLARTHPIWVTTTWVPTAVVWLGIATALAGALVALWQDDLKRLLAASTTSQYGYVIAALGAGGVAAGTAHLVNHAAFKALLFLGAGVLLHRLGTKDLREMGGLRRAMPALAAAFAVGALALAAVPPLGGFFTKDEILSHLFRSHRAAWWVGLTTAVLTAAYAGKAWLGAFASRVGEVGGRTAAPNLPGRVGSPGGGEVGGRTAAPNLPGRRREGLMLGPMVVLGLGAIGGAAIAVGSGRRAWEHLLAESASPPPHTWELALSAGLAVTGVAIAWGLSRRGGLVPLVRVPALAPAAERWFGLERAGEWGVVRPVLLLSRSLAAFDERVVDGGIRGATAIGGVLSRVTSTLDVRGVDGIVRGVARGIVDTSKRTRTLDDQVVDEAVRGGARSTASLATASAWLDDRTVDAAVEAVASGVRRLGSLARRPQTGVLYQYYVMAAAGIGIAAVLLMIGVT